MLHHTDRDFHETFLYSDPPTWARPAPIRTRRPSFWARVFSFLFSR